MFRPMRRDKQHMDPQALRHLLKTERRGVLSMIGDGGYPYAIPMNFYYDEERNAIYLHGSSQGHKIDALKACPKACFTVYDAGVQRPDDWSYDVNSVVAFCRAELMTEEKEKERALIALAEKYFPPEEDPAGQARQGAARTQMICLHIEHMTGKRVHER